MGRDRHTDILKLRGLGWTQTRIASELGITQPTVSYVLRKHGAGAKQRPRRDVRRQRLVAEFLQDPGSLPSDANLSPTTCLLLLQECKEHVNRNHVKALSEVEAVMDVFGERMKDAQVRRIPSLERRFRCSYVQALGLRAFCDRKSEQLSEAESRLRKAISRDCRGCVACLADLYRRLGVVLLFQRRFEEAHAAVTTALELYRRVGGTGHDLNGLPREACLALRSMIHVYISEFDEGKADAAAALRTVPTTKRSLRLQLLLNLAWSQLRLPFRFADPPILPLGSQVQAAKETLYEAVALFDDEDLEESHSAERASTYWLSGVIDGLEGNRAAAAFKLGVARDDFKAIPMPDKLIICASDLALFASVNPRQAQAWIASSVSWPSMPEYLSAYEKYLPPVMEPGLPHETLGRRIGELRRFAASRAA